MNIVIVGGGEVGRYIASILSKQQHNIILIDNNKKHLDEAVWQIDVATRLGSGTDWELLNDLMELSPQLFIALTGSDETNLAACSIAKHLGYPRTIARVKGNRYLNRARLDFARIFNVDYFISPELLVANDILKTMVCPASLAVESFAHGAVQMRTLIVPQKWGQQGTPLMELNLPEGLMIGLIYRKTHFQNDELQRPKVIFPHGNDEILPGDEITVIGEREAVIDFHRYLGITQEDTESVVIIGGSLTGLNLARLLTQQGIDVRIVEKDYEKCQELAEKLPKCSILNHDAADVDFLLAEKIGAADVLVSCTESDEVNLVTAMLGKETGCQQAIVMLSNISYISLAEKNGFNHVVSPRISAANHILSQLSTGKISSLVSLYDNQAEIVEINVSLDSMVVGISLTDLGHLLPQDFLIAMIQNRGRLMVAHGSRIISPGDTVIVITNPKHMQELEKIF